MVETAGEVRKEAVYGGGGAERGKRGEEKIESKKRVAERWEIEEARGGSDNGVEVVCRACKIEKWI